MRHYDKLVRDEIPNIIEENGKTAVYRVADGDEEFVAYLWEKLLEEVGEFRENPSYEEAADVMEVFGEVLSFFRLTTDNVNRARLDKYNDRGGFDSRYILVRVED